MDYEYSLNHVQKSVEDLYKQESVSFPKAGGLRRAAERHGTRTKWGNYNFTSTVKNRSAGLTVYVGSDKVRQARLNKRQQEILSEVPKTIRAVGDYLKKAPFVCIDKQMGSNDCFTPHCRLYVSTTRPDSIHLGYMADKSLLDLDLKGKGKKPRLNVVHIPEWQEKNRQVLVFPEIGVTYILGSDYYGETKKAFLRLGMWYAKQEGMLGLHAGAKLLYARCKEGKLRKYGMLLFGLTATGKTTHTCHDHGLKGEGEGIQILQDDVVFLRRDGSALGTERGFFLKTEGLTQECQPLIYNAATKPDAIFENVMVDHQGNVYLDDLTLTGNGRGVLQRSDLAPYISESIDLPPLEELDGLIIIFITRRNTIVPIVTKLTLEQAAAAFMLGESIETSGSDPRRVGESVREVGTNPFIIGSEAEEGEWFYDFLRENLKVECYQINTGGVGEIMEVREDGTKVVKQEVRRPDISETAAIIRGIARKSIEWQDEPFFSAKMPKRVEGINIERFRLSNFYSDGQVEDLIKKLKRERRAWFERFPDLESEVATALCGEIHP
jgi:phosphoenolpyruvate carboxykinase (ATP)